MKIRSIHANPYVYGIAKSRRDQLDFSQHHPESPYQTKPDTKKTTQTKTDAWIKNTEPDWSLMNRQMEIAQQQTEEEQKKLETLLQCMEIFRRISGGDNVPQADHEYLLEHDSAMYARAITLRFPKQDPYDYDQLSTNENEEQQRIDVIQPSNNQLSTDMNAEEMIDFESNP